jgi:hypothetical protein
MSRIIRVKFLYRAASDELDAGHPFAAGMAISLLQDAVEALAHEAAASVNATLKPRANFLDHWDAVAATGKSLPYKIEMTELNQARVGFKHLGVNPAISDAEKHMAAAHRFLVETAREFFSTDFDVLSEADLIENAKLRAAIRESENVLTAGNAELALEHCRDALDVVESLMSAVAVVSERDSKPPMSKKLQASVPDLINWTMRRFAALEKSVALSFLRINPTDYWFLYNSLPSKTAGGGYHWPARSSPIPIQTIDRARACIQIIINLALRVQRIHADMQRLALRSGIIEEQRRLKEWQDALLDQQTTDEAFEHQGETATSRETGGPT